MSEPQATQPYMVFRVRPIRASGLRQDDFSGSPTRWSFGQAPPRE
jgi:hypothetical protein